MRAPRAADLIPVTVVVILALACGRDRLLAPAAVGSASDARAEAEAPAEGDNGGFCAMGDQLCNDDPAVHAAHCVVVGDPPFGFSCECNAGFSFDPIGQRCRQAASPCLAAAVDSWPIRRPLDHADCDARPLLECRDSQTFQGKQRVSADLDALIADCHNPFARFVRIEFADGCPSLLEIQYDTVWDQEIADCLVSALSTKRWRCAESPTACELYEIDDLL